MSRLETPERILRRLEFKVVRRLDGYFFGDYTGIFYGPSLDLAEVREYQPGDEVRRIDWNVTARMNRLFVRQYLEERELTAWLLVDLSPSMHFGTRRQLKRETAVEFAGVAAYIVTRHGDKVGLLGFPGREVFIPPRGGRMHALRIIHALDQAASRDGGAADRPGDAQAMDLAASLRHLGRLLRRRSLVFLLSDFLGPQGWEGPLRELSRRHDVIAVWIQDPAERELPDVGGLFVRDPESGEQLWVDTSDPALRKAYRELVARQHQGVAGALRAARVDTMVLSTAEPLVDPLIRFIEYRRRKGRWSSAGR
ncbi:MAG: DUF58 domain-containing protein [Armatimonadota bacterium]|nr:DUF58 domain-containing protein [Armatimonadota bacterium]MDR7452224.1 DUF58 domain-containing protein [Armatimonadota bacterium]MDR7466681.1 DUF58 domain-containing protein [Armatimonadota bacterium]MDR7492845.1 DUF58 domain-containing protein [Armatimonadota bacterium]MDR7498621.1 DUF58 domain-containing protein [Armatimonadota bacterium]